MLSIGYFAYQKFNCYQKMKNLTQSQLMYEIENWQLMLNDLAVENAALKSNLIEMTKKLDEPEVLFSIEHIHTEILENERLIDLFKSDIRHQEQKIKLVNFDFGKLKKTKFKSHNIIRNDFKKTMRLLKRKMLFAQFLLSFYLLGHQKI
jgi:hypothetical protein